MHTKNQLEMRLGYVNWTLHALRGEKGPQFPEVTREEMVDAGITFLDWVMKDLKRLRKNKKMDLFDPELMKKEWGLAGSNWHQIFGEFKEALKQVNSSYLETFDWYSNYIEFKLLLDEGGLSTKQRVAKNLQDSLKKLKDRTISEDERECLIEIFTALKEIIKEEPVAELEARRKSRIDGGPLRQILPGMKKLL